VGASNESTLTFDASAVRECAEQIATLFPPEAFESILELLLRYLYSGKLDVVLAKDRSAIRADGTNEVFITLGFCSDLELLGAAFLASKRDHIVGHAESPIEVSDRKTVHVTDAMIGAAITAAQEYGLEDELANRLMWRTILRAALHSGADETLIDR
jgi:hypothetical protein